jgi:hypothetical protein
MGGPAAASQDGAVGYQSLPLDLVASLPHLPFPVYLRRDNRMVLYASSGADPRAILDHARSGLEIHVPSTDARVLRGLLVVLFARSLASRSEPVDDRGRRAVAFALALLEPLFGPERPIDPEAFIAGQAAVELLSRALAVDPDLRRAIVGAHASPGGTRHAVAPGGPAQARRFATRALDGLACAIALARTLDPGESGIIGTTVLDLGKGVAFRDLGLARLAPVSERRTTRPVAGGSAAVRSHPALGVRLISDALGAAPPWASIVAGHHERLDGSGYPGGRLDDQLPLPVRIAAVADAFASLIAPDVWGSVRAADEAMGVLRIGADRRFGDDLLKALAVTLESGGLLPIRRSGSAGPAH